MMIQARLVIMGDIFIKNGNFIAFATRNEGSRESMCGVTVLFSFCAGIMFSLWQRNRYF